MEMETETQNSGPTPEPASETADIHDNADNVDKAEISKTNDLKDSDVTTSVIKLNNGRSNNKSPSLTLGTSTTGGGTAEDCEIRNLEDYEAGSSSLTTPLSSSDLEQTPRSSVRKNLINFDVLGNS